MSTAGCAHPASVTLSLRSLKAGLKNRQQVPETAEQAGASAAAALDDEFLLRLRGSLRGGREAWGGAGPGAGPGRGQVGGARGRRGVTRGSWCPQRLQAGSIVQATRFRRATLRSTLRHSGLLSMLRVCGSRGRRRDRVLAPLWAGIAGRGREMRAPGCHFSGGGPSMT